MKKKIVSLMLITSMVAGLVAGCGGKDVSKNSDGKDLKEFSILWNEGANAPVDENWLVLDLLKERAGVKLNIQAVPSSDYETKRQITMNSGNMPDIIAHTFAKPSDALSGLLLPISDYVDQMPNFKNNIEKNDLQKYLDVEKMQDGKYYTLPVRIHDKLIQDHQWMVRKDILDKNNLQMPTTMEELLELGKKLKEIYPESTPISCRFGANNIMSGMAAAFGTIAGWTYGDGMYYDYDKKEWIFAPTTDSWKDLLTITHEMYQSGALDKEFATLDTTIFEQNIFNNKILIAYDWISNCKKMNLDAKATNPDFNMVPMPAPEGYKDKYAIEAIGSNSQGWVFPATVKDKDYFDDLLKFIDWCYSDEGAETLTFGKEGVSFQVKDGVKQWMEGELAVDHQAKYGLTQNELCVREDMDFYKFPTTDKPVAELYEESAARNMIPMKNPTSPLSADKIDELSVVINSVKDYVSASMEKFIYGQMPMSDWDKYVKECNAKGADKIQKAYDEATKK